MRDGKVEKKNTRYASWGSDKAYKWRWRAALQDAFWAFKQRMKAEPKDNDLGRCTHCRNFHHPHCGTQDA